MLLRASLLVTVVCVMVCCYGMEIYRGDGCLERCPVTTYYSPVCGTDYVTYTSPASLLCYKKCRNPELGVAHFASCVDWIMGNVKL